jgi:hypothetical protein
MENQSMPPQPKLTIEQEEERKLRSKYPNPQKPGGSAFIQKMLHKGSKKYFDSGDYNMAKSKKQGLLNGLGGNNKVAGNNPSLPTSNANTPSQNTNMKNQNASTPISQRGSEGMTPSFKSDTNTPNNTNNTSTDQVMSVSDLNSPNIVNVSNISLESNSLNLTPSLQQTNTNNNNDNLSISSKIPKPCTPNQKQGMNTQMMNENSNNNTNNSNFNLITSNNSSSPQLSTSISTNTIQNNNQHNTNYLNPMGHLQGSQSSQSISLLSSSTSSDKIAHIQINQQQQMLDSSDEIGHGIPTPECLPQSRKHSIVQSKLATPRLSSS